MDSGTTIVVGDEEDQQKISAILDELQSEVRELRDKTEHDMQNANNTIELQEQKIRDLENRMSTCDESKSGLQIQLDELQHEIDQLKEHGGTSSTSTTAGIAPSSNVTRNPPSNTTPSSSRSPASSFFQRNISNHDGLPDDTFTLMNISPFRSQAWFLGLFTYTFQMVLICMIGTNQLQESIMSSDFNVPFKVDPVVRAGQFFTIIFALATQHDILSSVRFLIMFWNHPYWDRTLLGRDENEPRPTSTEWVVHILIPNVLKFVQGILVMLATFVVIVQSDNIIELLKDFTALMILSETDNIFFRIAANGYLGSELQMKSMEARAIKVENESTNSDSHGTLSSSSKHFLLRPVILLFITTAMIGGWLYIVINQINGTYFQQRYPKCYLIVPNAFQLATEQFGDGICYGGPLNTIECEFEDGDCANFNTAYPLCKGDDRTNVQDRVGDRNCDAVFMNSDCDYDGGDCCDFIDDPAFGDGTCDEEMNTEGCGYDNGDCIAYNRDFAGCPLDVVLSNPTFGDGQCNGGISSTARCGYDNGDCNQARISYPNCPFEDLSNFTGAEDVILGNGFCDGNIYNVKDCGFEYGDCYQSQVGQTIALADDVRSSASLFFSKVLSFDGNTLAIGLYRTNKDGHYDDDAPGMVKVWRFKSERKLWFRLGGTIASPSGLGKDNFGRRMSISASGNHLAISSSSGLRVFQLINPSSGAEEWSQLGQTLIYNAAFYYSNYSHGIISSDGSRVALVHNWKQIWIYNLKSHPDGPTWMHDDDLDVIGVGAISDLDNANLRFASSDGSRLFFTESDSTFVKAFQQISQDVAWTQMGQDIEKAYNSLSMAMSSNGNRIAVHIDSGVQVLDYNGAEWVRVGSPIVSSSSLERQEFDYSIDISANGNRLLVGMNHPGCRYVFNSEISIFIANRFETEKCTKSSRALIELYTYYPSQNQFITTLSRKGVEDAKEISDGSILYGLHFSLGNGDNGSYLLSISNYDLVNDVVFVDVIDLDALYYTKCVVDKPDYLGDGICHYWSTYNTEACGFDGGDC